MRAPAVSAYAESSLLANSLPAAMRCASPFSTTLPAAASLPVSQDFVGWLQEQPPSGIVAAALAASHRGLDMLRCAAVDHKPNDCCRSCPMHLAGDCWLSLGPLTYLSFPLSFPLSFATCSAHLVHDCSERGLQALVGATQRSPAGVPGEAGSGGTGAAAGGAGGAEGPAEGAMDDLLFFADKEGDATMFGRCAFCLHLRAAWLPGCASLSAPQ